MKTITVEAGSSLKAPEGHHFEIDANDNVIVTILTKPLNKINMKYSKQLTKSDRMMFYALNWCHKRCVQNFEKECKNWIKIKRVVMKNYNEMKANEELYYKCQQYT